MNVPTRSELRLQPAMPGPAQEARRPLQPMNRPVGSGRRPPAAWYWLVLLLLAVGKPATAHNGEDHDAPKTTAAPGATYFTTSAESDNFELVLRYTPLRAGQPATLRLFVSDFVTNVPIAGATLTLTTTGAPAVRLTATETAPGEYRLSGQFPANRAYALAVQVTTPDGRADLLLLQPVEVGKDLPAPAAAAGPSAGTPWLTWRGGLLALGGLLLGAGLTAALLRRRRPITSSSATSTAP